MVRRRLAARRGESIAETLVAVLIMALAFLMLSGAVVTAARINEQFKNDEQEFTVASASAQTSDEAVIEWDGSAPADATVRIRLHQRTDASGGKVYTYYEPDQPTPGGAEETP